MIVGTLRPLYSSIESMGHIYIVAGAVLHWSEAGDLGGGGVRRTVLGSVVLVVLFADFDSFSV